MKKERTNSVMRILLGFLFSAMLVGGLSAQSAGVHGLVLDSADGHAISDAQLGWIGEEGLVITDVEGRFTLPLRNGGTRLEVTHVAYRTKQLVYQGEKSLTDGRWVIWLGSRTIELEAAEIKRAKPEVIFERKDVHAADLFINGDGLWVLAYQQPRMLRAEADQSIEILRDVRLVLLDTLYNEKATATLKEDVLGLYHDLRDMPIVRGTGQAYGAALKKGALALMPFPLERLDKAVLPWTDSIPDWVLGTAKDDVIPRVDHVALAPALDSSTVVACVVDSFMMQLFRSEYKYLSGHDKVIAMDLAREFRTDPETVAGYMAGFDKNIWFKPVYAPMFVVQDTLLVFDHCQGRMLKYDHSFKQRGEAPISHHLNRKGRDWKGRLLQDRRSGTIYAQYERFGQSWLQTIDPHTGDTGAITRLTYKYPEKVQVFDGYVYYIHRPFESLQKRTIYRERVR